MKKPSAAQLYSIRSRAGELGTRINLNLKPVEFKEWKLDAETLRVWERAARPFESVGSDGRNQEMQDVRISKTA